MSRPDIDHVARLHAVLLEIDGHLTEDQVRDFVQCAQACGLTVGQWVIECAEVQAAAVRDAMQAPERRQRNGLREARSERAAQIMAARRAKDGGP